MMEIEINMAFKCPTRGDLEYRVTRAVKEGSMYHTYLFLLIQTGSWLAHKMIGKMAQVSSQNQRGDGDGQFPDEVFNFEYITQSGANNES